MDGSNSTNQSESSKDIPSSSCNKSMSPTVGNQKAENNEVSNLSTAIKEEFTYSDEANSLSEIPNPSSNRKQTSNQHVPYFPGLQLPHVMNFRNHQHFQPSIFPNPINSCELSPSVISLPRPQHHIAREPMTLAATQSQPTNIIGGSIRLPPNLCSIGRTLDPDPVTFGFLRPFGMGSKIELSGGGQGSEGIYNLGRLRGRPSAADSGEYISYCSHKE